MKLFSRIVFTAIMILASISMANAAIKQLPEWYEMKVDLDAPPQLHKELKAKVTIASIIGNLENVTVRLILPEGWTVDSQEKKPGLIKAGETAFVTFNIVPQNFLTQGSIIAEASLIVPKQAIENQIQNNFPNEAKEMIQSVRAWPKVTKRYSEISFALLEEESFYPLNSGMWLSYFAPLSPGDGFKGPVFYNDPIVTTYQAQTDVEMYEKLVNYIKADPALETKLTESGIDLNKKKYDQLNGIYVLATNAFIEKNFTQAKSFIERLESELKNLNSGWVQNLEIAALNLKGIIFWTMNQKRLAEDSLKKAFYTNRKNPLQRYVLRNISLLMLSNNEKTTAEHMMRLALDLKPGYTQLEKEYSKVKSHK